MYKVNHLMPVVLVSILIGVSGCAASKEEQLQQVAKDWCLTIRASQVIPVYPLTEDLQPGDIFLVQQPIDKQQCEYHQNGFLPLDNLIARLNPVNYTNFYRDSFLYTNAGASLPHDWTSLPSTNWNLAPHAAFPSYTFEVKSGEGLNLAVPIDGVPVGLGLMNSDAAYGSVNIDQARTIGVDTISLWNQVRFWANLNKDFLRRYSPDHQQTNYVRVLTRVYACGQLDVSLRDASSQSGGLDVGAAKPVNLLFPDLSSSNATANVVNTYTNQLNILQLYTNGLNALQSSLPGGSVRIAAAGSRTVAMQQTFVPPLIIGYLGFDCEILPGGELGPPIPTHAHLDNKSKTHNGNATLIVPTDAELKLIGQLTAKIGQLKNNNDTVSAISILADLGVEVPPGGDAFEALQEEVRAADLDHSLLPPLAKAFGVTVQTK